MTLPVQVPQIEYAEDGVSTSFPVPFRYRNPTDVRVLRRPVSGSDELLSYGSDYTLTNGDTAAGGTLSMSIAGPSGGELVVWRETPLKSDGEYETTGAFTAESHEALLDEAAMRDQDLRAEIRSALRVARGKAVPEFDVDGFLDGDILEYRDGGLRRLQREEFAGKFYGGSASGRMVPLPGTGADEGLRTALADKYGAALVGFERNAVDAKTRELREWLGDQAISITDFEGSYPDGSGDSSYAFEAAKSAVEARGGGTIMVPGNFLIGEQEIAQQNTVIRGHSPDDEIIVKSGTLGVHIKADWVHFRDLTIRSEGTQLDGQGTSGVLYSEGPGNSTGHVFNYGLRIRDFNGYGMEVRNTLDLQIIGMFIRDCMTGFRIRREGTGSADFSTTVNMQMCYGISCDVAYDLLRVRHSLLTHMICEYNRIGIVADLSDFGLNYGYFENNSEKGVDSINSAVADHECYHNGANDEIFRSYPGGVIAAADRYHRQTSKDKIGAKRFGFLSPYGTNPQYLEAHGTTTPLGLRFGTSTMAMRRPGQNLFKPNKWEGEGNGSGSGAEFKGWNPVKGGFEISGSTTGARGLRQPVTVVEGATYVMDWRVVNAAGVSPATARVGTDTVQNGLPFTASASGEVIAKLFGVQSGSHENYIPAISLAKVDVADQTLIADMQYRLSRAIRDRDLEPMAAPPASTTGYAPTELLPNSNPTVQGSPGSQYVVVGWRAIGGAWVEARELTGT